MGVTASTMIDFLAQRGTDWSDLIVLAVIVGASVFGSVGKWIAKRINESKEADSQRRTESETLMAPRRERPTLETAKPLHPAPVKREVSLPPFSAPAPPVRRRAMKPIGKAPAEPTSIERVFEVILEQATGVKIERETPPPAPVASPPPAPAQAQPPNRPPRPTKPTTIVERERQRAAQLAGKRTAPDRESARMTEREQRFTKGTDRRLGHVGTHIAAFDRSDAEALADEVRGDQTGRFSLRDAIVWSEILAPPLALRETAPI